MTVGDLPPDDLVEKARTIEQRLQLLETLREEPGAKRDIIDQLDLSRSTIDRAIAALETIGAVERGNAGYETTLAGRLAADRYRKHIEEMGAIFDAAELLAPLSCDCDLPIVALTGSKTTVPAETAPYRPLEELYQAIGDADRYRAVRSRLEDSRHFRLCYEHVISDGNEADLVVSPSLRATLREDFPQQLSVALETEQFDFRVGPGPDYDLILTDNDGTTTVWILVFGESGSFHGLIRNDSPSAADWAQQEFERRREAATPVTPRDPDHGDGDRGLTDGAGGAEQLPSTLLSQGFVRLTAPYFTTRDVAAPTTAWRAGLDLAEVQAEYDFQRPGPTEDRTLSGHVFERLYDQAHVAVLGPPGSGKSTVCKQVARRWYRQDDPVFYRDAGLEPFEDVDTLLAVVRMADGHPLVVIEDATRTASRAVFEFVDRAPDDVAVLVDARAEEWRSPPGEALDPDTRSSFATVRVPSLRPDEYDRFIDHVETTIDRPLNLDADRLRGEITNVETPADDLLHLVHHVALRVDPAATDATRLEDHVDRFITAIDRDPAPLRLALLINLLNIGGVDVHEAYLYAIADDQTGIDADAVTAAVETLDGQLLFGSPAANGTYRTVHESWSLLFFTRLPEHVDPDEFREPFQSAVAALLGLADDEDRRDRICERVARPAPALSQIQESPSEWVDTMVNALFERAELPFSVAQLYGDLSDLADLLPAVCPRATELHAMQRLTRMYLYAGELNDAATLCAELDQRIEQAAIDSDTADTLRADMLISRGSIAEKRGEFDRAEDAFKRALTLRQSQNDRHGCAEAYIKLGSARSWTGAWESAKEALQRAKTIGDEIESPQLVSRTGMGLGQIYDNLEDHERAESALQTALETATSIDDRRGEAKTAAIYANVLIDQHDLAGARTYYSRALELDRSRDEPFAIGSDLVGLGLVEFEAGNLENAREYMQTGLERYDEADDPRGKVTAYYNLGRIDRRRGAYDAAAEAIETALELAEAIDYGNRIGQCRMLLGAIAADRGDLDTAAEQLDEALAAQEDTGKDSDHAHTLMNAARVAARRGHPETATEYAQRASSYAAEGTNAAGAAHLATAASEVRQGNETVAIEQFQAALATVPDANRWYRAIISSRLGWALARTPTESEQERETTARTHFQRALELAQQCGYRRVELYAQAGFATVTCQEGALDAARDRHEAASDLSDTIEDVSAEARLERISGDIAAADGSQQAAIQAYQRALEIYGDIGEHYERLETLDRLIDVCEDDSSAAFCDRALSLAQSLGLPERAARIEHRKSELETPAG